MSIDWGEYQIYRPIGKGPVRLLPRKEARAEYNHLMAEKETRIGMLYELTARYVG